jgi:hypothetical protein
MIRMLAVALCVLAPLSAHAQTLDEIVAKHLEARGGLDRLRAIRTVRVIAHESEGPVVVVEEKRPNLIRTTKLNAGVTAADYEKAVRNMQGDSNPIAPDQVPISSRRGRDEWRTTAYWVWAFDGTNHWEWSPVNADLSRAPARGPDIRTLADNDRQNLSIQSPLMTAPEQGSRVELTGKARTEGRACYALRVTSPQGVVRNLFIDAQTYLEVALEYEPQGGSPGWRRTYHAWRVVDGVTVPHTIKTIQQTQRHVRLIDRVEFNVPIDDRRFAMPAAAK